MTLEVKVAGAWKTITPSVKVSGVWEDLTEGWVKVSGVWRQFYSASGGSASISLSNATVTDNTLGSGDPASASYTLDTDGSIYENTSTGGVVDIGDWIDNPALASNYDCRMTTISGSLTSGSAGSWTNISTDIIWSRSRVVSGTNTYVGTLEIAHKDNHSVILASATITLTATV